MPGTISDKIVREVIEKGLDSLGQTPKQAVWFCLEKESGFDREKLPENLRTFEEALQKLFGFGYSFLKTLFMQFLQDAVGEDLHGYSSFTECVKYLYEQAEEKAKISAAGTTFEIDVPQPVTIQEK